MVVGDEKDSQTARMSALRTTEWQKLPISLQELCINTTLRCGQSFRWRHSPATDEWTCTLRGRIVSLRQDASHLHYRSSYPHPSPPSSTTTALPTPPPTTPVPLSDDDTLPLLRHYFNLTPNLPALYAHWSAVDSNFARHAPQFAGVRILQQDAWEALVCFICSSNNHIARIAQMVARLCAHYGPRIGELGGTVHHGFPTAAALAGEGVEGRLRELGFGYRAGYLQKTARMVVERGEGWLEGLRNPETVFGGEGGKEMGAERKGGGEAMPPGGREGFRRAREALVELSGVGPKVADCVCLMGLGWGEAVPVDTHVWQIAQRDYRFGKGKGKSLTAGTYEAVADMFRALWGTEAGWAHSVLFTADLKAFAERREGRTEVVVKREGKEEVKEEVIETKLEKKVARTKRGMVEEGNTVITVRGIATEVRRSKRQKRT